MPLQVYLFDADSTDKQLELSKITPDFVQNLSDRQLLWLDMTGLDKAEIEQLQTIFNLHPQSVTNLLKPLNWPRFDNYSNYFQMNVIAIKGQTEPKSKSKNQASSAEVPAKKVATTADASATESIVGLEKTPHSKSKARFKSHTYRPIELDLICGTGYVITAHNEPIEFLENFNEQLKGNTQVGELDALAFLVVLLDWQLSSYLDVSTELELEIDRLDEYALKQSNSRHFLEQLTTFRRKVSHVRQMLNPHRQSFSMLARPDFEVVAKSKSAAYFRSLNSRLERVIDMVENAREMVIGSFDLYMTGTAQNTNETMKLLTLGTIILGVIAAIAGIMGVNFDMDLFKTGVTGFWIMLSIMLGLVGAILALAKHRNWL